MAFVSPQGIDFRASNTAPYNTDPANCDYEIYAGTAGNYGSHVTLQGNNVGWIGPMNGSGGPQGRDRSSSVDRRLAGCNFNTLSTEKIKYAFDVPPGTYRVRIAAGENNYARSVRVEAFDNAVSLGVLCSSPTTAGGKFRDATNAEYTAAAWPGSNSLSGNLTVSTGPLIFQLGDGTNQCYIAHIWVESVATGGAVLQGAALTVASASGSLTSQIRLSGNAASVTTASGGLTAQIKLGGAALAQAISSAALSSGIRLTAGAIAAAAGNGTLTTVINLIGAAAGQASAAGSLNAGSGLSASATASAAASAVLSAQIQFSAVAIAQAAGMGSLSTTPSGLSGSAAASAAAPASLTATIRLSADAIAAAITTGSLTAQIPLSASAVAQALASAGLSTGPGGFGGIASASGTATGNLTAQIRMGGNAQAASGATGTLSGMETMAANPHYIARAIRRFAVRATRSRYAIMRH